MSFKSSGQSIGVARMFLWGALFSSKVDDLFLVAALKTQAKTTKLTAPALQIFPAHQKCALKFDLLLCLGLGMYLPASGCTYNFPYKIRPTKFFLRPGGTRAPIAPYGYSYE